jgi:hypothetical protein
MSVPAQVSSSSSVSSVSAQRMVEQLLASMTTLVTDTQRAEDKVVTDAMDAQRAKGKAVLAHLEAEMKRREAIDATNAYKVGELRKLLAHIREIGGSDTLHDFLASEHLFDAALDPVQSAPYKHELFGSPRWVHLLRKNDIDQWHKAEWLARFKTLVSAQPRYAVLVALSADAIDCLENEPNPMVPAAAAGKKPTPPATYAKHLPYALDNKKKWADLQPLIDVLCTAWIEDGRTLDDVQGSPTAIEFFMAIWPNKIKTYDAALEAWKKVDDAATQRTAYRSMHEPL